MMQAGEAESQAAEGGRRKHVRRRALAARGLAAVAAASLLAGALVGSRAADQPPSSPPSACMDPATGLDLAAGQSVVVRMENQPTRALVRQARKGEIGGVILFPDPEVRGKVLSRGIARLQRAATGGGNPPLLVAIDQEGGAVERIPALPPAIGPFTLRVNDDPKASRLEGRATGFALRELGINVDLAPVLDVPASEQQFMAPRAFGLDPQTAARLGLAFAKGLRRDAVAATAKHFPGLGRAAENTDLAPATVSASAAALAQDIEPFRAAARIGIDLIMVSSASYPRLGSRSPAVLSPEISEDLLRGDVGFEGLVISDDLLAPALTAVGTPRSVGIQAKAAGVDLLLYAREPVNGIAAALAGAVGAGRLDEGRLRASCERILALKERLDTGEPL